MCRVWYGVLGWFGVSGFGGLGRLQKTDALQSGLMHELSSVGLFRGLYD